MLMHIWESLKEIVFISVSTLYLGEKKTNKKHWLGGWLCLGFVLALLQINFDFT